MLFLKRGTRLVSPMAQDTSLGPSIITGLMAGAFALGGVGTPRCVIAAASADAHITPMPTLTRRRSHDSHRETWIVFYGDVPVGTITERAGVPADLDQWGWTCGFYPGVEPRQHRHGAAPTFEEARAGFEEAWNGLLPTLTKDALRLRRRL